MIELTKEQVYLIYQILNLQENINSIDHYITENNRDLSISIRKYFQDQLPELTEELKTKGIIMPDLTTKGEKHDK